MPKKKAKHSQQKASGNAPEMLDLSNSMAMAFATPFVAHPWPDSEQLNEELKQLILKKESESEGMVRSNVSGWHSNVDFFSWEGECIKKLGQRIEQALMSLTRAITVAPEEGNTRRFGYRVDGWANINRRGAYNTVHNHPNCLWSGVYYVAAGEPDPEPPHNGKLELLDPRVGTNMIYNKGTIFDARYVIDPIPGLMVMFPSWLNHLVHPFLGDEERISIAFNIVTTEMPSAEQLA